MRLRRLIPEQANPAVMPDCEQICAAVAVKIEAA
jgi:hypothetical protein